jgi:hypothetical protein
MSWLIPFAAGALFGILITPAINEFFRKDDE